MKTLLCLLLCLPLRAATVPLGWGPSEGATKYFIYEHFVGEPAKVGESLFSQADVPGVTPGTHIYSVTAVNEAGESGHSNTVMANVIVVNVESSLDLQTWTVKHQIEEVVVERKFYRVKWDE